MPALRCTTSAVLLLALAACAGEEEDPLCAREVPLTYQSWGQGFLDTHCNGCHSSLLVREELRNGAPLGIDFDTLEGTWAWAERAYQRGAIEVSMPPGGGPGPEELRLYEEWMLCSVLPDAAAWENAGGGGE